MDLKEYQEEKNNYQKQTINLIHRSNTFKLFIPAEVEKKIRYICQKINKNEWSGILFYEVHGNFENNNLTVKCKDIYVMDIGNAAFTEFSMSPEVISYMTEHPELLDCQIGLIHSHDEMATFFSGTDIDTLREEGMNRNHFVSLIVNNEGSYTAAITRKVKSVKNIQEEEIYSSFNDNQIKNNKTYTDSSEYIEWFYLNIEFEDLFRVELESRLQQIKQFKKNTNIIPPVSIEWQNSPSSYPSLFDCKKNSENSYCNYSPKKSKCLSSIPLSVKPNNKIIKALTLQLLTGCVIIPNTDKIDVKKWIQNMIPLFEKRFGKGKQGLDLFRNWADGFIDFICWFTIDKNLGKEDLEDEEIASLIAENLIHELSQYPSNVYIEIYIDILNGFLL